MLAERISVLETPVVAIALQTLLTAVNRSHFYPWSTSSNDEQTKPITREELDDCLKTGERVEPGVYSDDEDEGLSNAECPRPEHIRRICWLIENWDDELYSASPIMLSLPPIADDNQCLVANGHHRLAAAAYLNKEEITVSIISGSINTVTKLLSPAKWESIPHNEIFGYNLISIGAHSWEFQSNVDKTKLWLNNVNGGCNLQLCITNFQRSAIISNDESGSRKIIKGNDLCLDSLLHALSEMLSPAFLLQSEISLLFANFFDNTPLLHSSKNL